MVVVECVAGDGGLCGAVFLDEAFDNLLVEKVGEAAWKFVPAETVNKFRNEEWEHGIKKQFQDQDQPWAVTLPDECQGQDNGSGKKTKRRRNVELSR